MTTANQMHRGMAITYNNDLFVVKDFRNTMPGKGGAFVQATLKNVKSGKIINVRFRSTENVDVAFVSTRPMQYLYQEQGGYVFMDQENYEQITIPEDIIGGKAKYLVDELELRISFHEGTPLNVDFPSSVVMEITHTMPGEKGDSANKPTKEATVSGGFDIQVPLFIKIGDKISINTETGDYISKAN